ncbi:hypothetical protein FRC02_002681 [Tulasnella sp. 418]|nr:hypothetical protein FRC02_002681 [Tulasnella sp. 418]
MWGLNTLLYLVAATQLVRAFVDTKPSVAWQSISPGWNLGNTLDAIPNEDSWGNGGLTAQTFDDIKAAGFKSVRIPVTWTHHFQTEAPSYTVDPTFMTRVETVVDWALARDFWVVLNVHHDSWEWADLSTYTPGQVDKLEKLWTQIATRFNAKSEKLIFESLNEPAGSPDNQVTADLYNDLNTRFLNIVRNSGGYNAKRITSLPSLHTNIELGNLYFKDPPAGTDYWTYQYVS